MVYSILPNRVRRTYRGGEKLDAFTQYTAPNDGNFYPEDWTASVTAAFNGDSEIAHEGLGMTEDGKRVRDIAGGRLPILVKLLDASERLVVQAHPTVEFAKRELNSNYGKTECWYFLDCAKDAYVYLGFREGIQKSEWISAFYAEDSEKILSMLNKIHVKKGDFVFVGGGVPHAIGEGCFMIELQEPSDFMVVAEKQTPSGRTIPEAKLHMGLGCKKMFDVYDYTGYSLKEIKEKYCPKPRKICDGLYEILGEGLTDRFTMKFMNQNASFAAVRPASVAVVIEGGGKLCQKDVRKRRQAFNI